MRSLGVAHDHAKGGQFPQSIADCGPPHTLLKIRLYLTDEGGGIIRPIEHSVKGDDLTIYFHDELSPNIHHQVSVNYRATPKRGVKFYKDHIFTIYHTDNWLISHKALFDKATTYLHDAPTESTALHLKNCTI